MAFKRENFVFYFLYHWTKNGFSMCSFLSCSVIDKNKLFTSTCIHFETLWDCGDHFLHSNYLYKFKLIFMIFFYFQTFYIDESFTRNVICGQSYVVCNEPISHWIKQQQVSYKIVLYWTMNQDFYETWSFCRWFFFIIFIIENIIVYLNQEFCSYNYLFGSLHSNFKFYMSYQIC